MHISILAKCFIKFIKLLYQVTNDWTKAHNHADITTHQVAMATQLTVAIVYAMHADQIVNLDCMHHVTTYNVTVCIM